MLLGWAVVLLLQASPLERQAYRAYQQRDWPAAIRLYQSWHASGVGTAASFDNLGVAFTNLSRWEQAESALQQAIALNPRHRWAYNHLGFVYREQNRHSDAEAMFRRQIEISPKDPYAYRNLAGLLALVGRFSEAGEVALLHEQLTSERGSVYIDMACNLNSRNQPAQAKLYLRQAEASGVERSLLAQESAHYFLSVRDYRRAEQQYLKLGEYRPLDPAPALRLGMLYYQTANLEKSAAAFGRAIIVEESGQVRIRTSATQTKVFSLADLGPELPGDLPVDLRVAALLIRLQDSRQQHRKVRSPASLARFLAACEEFLDKPLPAEAEAWAREALAAILLQAGQVREARQQLERAIQAAPRRRMTAYRLAVIHEQFGELDEALALYTRSLEPLPDTEIDCGCEQPDLAAREKTARALYAKRRGDEAGFEAYRRSLSTDYR